MALKIRVMPDTLAQTIPCPERQQRGEVSLAQAFELVRLSPFPTHFGIA